MIFQQELANISRVAPGADSIIECPVGGQTYQRAFLTFTSAGSGGGASRDLSATSVEDVSVRVDGKPIMEFSTLQHLLDFNAYRGYDGDAVSATEITVGLHFFRAELEEKWKRLGGIGTLDISRLTIRAKIAADVLNGAPDDIAMTAYADIDSTRQALGAFFRVTEYPTNADVAGWNELNRLPSSSILCCLDFVKSDVTEVEMKADSVEFIEATKESLEARSKNASPKARAPITARRTHVDFTVHGDLGDCPDLRQSNNFRVKYKATATGNLTVVAETLDTLNDPTRPAPAAA